MTTLTPHPRPRVRFALTLALVAAFAGSLLLGSAASASGGEPTHQLDLPADSADKALKRLSAQTGREVLFPTEAVAGVQTRPVRGLMTAEAALDAMLEGTPLIGIKDPQTGALTVRRQSDRPTPKAPAARVERPEVTRAATTTADGVVELSEFVVRAGEDRGYRATNSVSGSRTNIAIRDIPIFQQVANEDLIDAFELSEAVSHLG